MFTVEESWGMSEPEMVLAIIREVECWRLGHWDGCCCSRFSIRNVDVAISCGKGGEQAVHVSSHSLGYAGNNLQQLRPVLEEVARQAEEQSGRGGIFIRYLDEVR